MPFSAARSDAIVVLGCRVEPTGSLSPALRRRADWAAVAYRAGLGGSIVASGGRRWGRYVEAERVLAHLEASGIPREAIHTELLSLTTAENALFSAELLGRLKTRRALVVTCAWHMPRALACFRRVGVEAAPIPVPAAPADLLARLYRVGHEAVSSRLDAWTLDRVTAARRRRGAHPFDPEGGLA